MSDEPITGDDLAMLLRRVRRLQAAVWLMGLALVGLAAYTRASLDRHEVRVEVDRRPAGQFDMVMARGYDLYDDENRVRASWAVTPQCGAQLCLVSTRGRTSAALCSESHVSGGKSSRGPALIMTDSTGRVTAHLASTDDGQLLSFYPTADSVSVLHASAEVAQLRLNGVRQTGRVGAYLATDNDRGGQLLLRPPLGSDHQYVANAGWRLGFDAKTHAPRRDAWLGVQHESWQLEPKR